jgi:Ser/Thr protein kinase RdoA (MazF antagonist)
MNELTTALSQETDSTYAHKDYTPPPSPVSRCHPFIYSTLSMEGIRQLLVRDYNLEDSGECRFISRSISDTYLFETPVQRFAFKVHRTNWRSREAALCELAILRHLHLKGVSVAMPVARRDGQLITEIQAPEGPRSAALFEWAQGRRPRYTDPDHAMQYGRTIAKMHIAGDDLQSIGAAPPMDLQHLIHQPLALIRSRLKDLPEVAKALPAFEQRIVSEATRATRQLKDWGFCHGDVWSNNARIDGNRLVLFDFDFCGPGWQIFDLASYRWHARQVGAEQAAWKPFIESYLQLRPTAANSLKYIGLFVILKHLWTTAIFISRGPETGENFLPDEELESLIPTCEKIAAEMPEGAE